MSRKEAQLSSSLDSAFLVPRWEPLAWATRMYQAGLCGTHAGVQSPEPGHWVTLDVLLPYTGWIYKGLSGKHVPHPQYTPAP